MSSEALASAPTMPAWMRALLLLSGSIALAAAAWFGLPLLDGDWQWQRALIALALVALGVDLVQGGVRRRLPLLLLFWPGV